MLAMRSFGCSCRCHCLFIILLAASFCHFGSAAADELPPKCCSGNQILIFNESGSTLECGFDKVNQRLLLHPPYYLDPSSDVFLEVHSYFPKCEDNETLITINAIQGNKISCLDKMIISDGRETLVGLMCIKEIGDGKVNEVMLQDDGGETFNVPDVFTINKCCPLERSYSGYVNGCWDGRVPDDWSYLQGLVEAVLNDSFGYLDLKIGAPVCKRYEVLYDFFVPYKFVFQLDSDAVKLRIPGREGYVILPPESVCLDFTGEDQLNLVVRACQDRTVLCEKESKTCIRKCCSDGEIMLDHTCIKSKHKFDPEFYAFVDSEKSRPPQKVNHYVKPAISFGMKCEKYLLCPDEEICPEEEHHSDDRHFLTVNGDLYFPSDSSFSKNYCIDILTSMELGNVTMMATFVCFDKHSDYSLESPKRRILYFVYGTGMIISCLFLLMTLLVYICLPALRNVHGKTIMCYIASLLVAYLCLTISQIGSVLNVLSDQFQCKLAGYATVFAFLAAFSWLNVLCFDIWYTFGHNQLRRLKEMPSL